MNDYLIFYFKYPFLLCSLLLLRYSLSYLKLQLTACQCHNEGGGGKRPVTFFSGAIKVELSIHSISYSCLRPFLYRSVVDVHIYTYETYRNLLRFCYLWCIYTQKTHYVIEAPQRLIIITTCANTNAFYLVKWLFTKLTK